MVCGAILCESRQMAARSAQSHLGAEPLPVDPAVRYSAVPLYHTVCSWECFDRWAWTFISRGHAPSVIGQNYVLGGVRLHPGTAGRAVVMAEDHRRGQRLEEARHLIEAEDHESAAGIYQSLGMWKEAGEVRRNGRRQIVKQVHVNVNDLVEQVRKAGIATDYTCPACRGHIRITRDTTLPTLRTRPDTGPGTTPHELVALLTG